GNEEVGENHVFLGDVQLNPSGFSSYQEESGPVFTSTDPAMSDPVYLHFKNFLDCVSSRKWQDLNADILEGHLSTSLCHLGNIACRLKRTLYFNPHAEKFVKDDEANSYLTKRYRSPHVIPNVV
ncbi:MAG: hypothetical protein OEQ53_11575, partial [Saprospiraceae bacterium]|nr:hypothetical protein [Saprospiraceae bacterium]